MSLCGCGATRGATVGGCLTTLQWTQGRPLVEAASRHCQATRGAPALRPWLSCGGLSPLLRAQVQRQGSMRRQLSHMGELVHSALGDAHNSTQACALCIRHPAYHSGHMWAVQDAWLCQCPEHTLLVLRSESRLVDYGDTQRPSKDVTASLQ